MAEAEDLVLLVEDNEDNRIIYATALEHAGFRVVVAGDGDEGIARARELRPGVILMDISMPTMDGWEATRLLKADPDLRHIPIVALTAHVMEAERERIRETGFDAYLAKPALPRAVVAEVRRILAGEPGSFFRSTKRF